MNLFQFIKYLMNEGDVQNLSINDLPTNLQATPSIEKSEEQKSKDWVKNFIKSLKEPYINKPNSKTLKPQKTQSENSTREYALKNQEVISKKIKIKKDQEQGLEH